MGLLFTTFSLGEKRGSAVEAYNEILDEAELNTLNQVLEVSTFNEFPEPLVSSKWSIDDSVDFLFLAMTLIRHNLHPFSPLIFSLNYS